MSRRRLPGTAAVVLALSLAPTACREGVSPYSPPVDEPSTAALLRLTHNAGDERDPHWAGGGDSIYYHTDAWFDVPSLRSALLRIPADGGTARLLAPAAQPGPFFRLMLPVPAPDGERIAYLHMVREGQDRVCFAAPTPCPAAPLLDSAVLRVRRLDAVGSVLDDAGVGIRFEGPTREIEPPFVEPVHPFQVDYRFQRDVTNLRPSWSPDGERLVFSDGLRLLVWRIGEAAPVPIPDTDDGVAPQWSPDGQRIAFGIIERGSERTITCNCSVSADSPPIPALRTEWVVAARRIAVIRPDGTGREVLTEGSDPAWNAAGDTLYFRRGEDGLFRVAAAGGSVQPVEGTHGARAPMVSASGAGVVFSRRLDTLSNFDLWRLRVLP